MLFLSTLLLSLLQVFASVERPIIGILTQPLPSCEGGSFLAHTLVHQIRASGGTPVVVPYDLPRDEFNDHLRLLHGIVFPGGNTNLRNGKYAEAIDTAFQTAVEWNDNGEHFPILGVCLGFQALTSRVSEDRDIIYGVDFNNVMKHNSLNFQRPDCHCRATTNFFKVDIPGLPTCPRDTFSRARWKDVSDIFEADDAVKLRALMEHSEVAYSNHRDGITIGEWNSDVNLQNFFWVLSTSKTKTGLEFVSTIEAKCYPFYATQWHPEKYTFAANAPPRTPEEYANRYVGEFFVSEAQLSNRTSSFNDYRAFLLDGLTPVPVLENLSVYVFNCSGSIASDDVSEVSRSMEAYFTGSPAIPLAKGKGR